MQRGRHLDFADAVADAVQTCQMRAEQLDDLLKTFMFVIPRVRHSNQSALKRATMQMSRTALHFASFFSSQYKCLPRSPDRVASPCGLHKFARQIVVHAEQSVLLAQEVVLVISAALSLQDFERQIAVEDNPAMSDLACKHRCVYITMNFEVCRPHCHCCMTARYCPCGTTGTGTPARDLVQPAGPERRRRGGRARGSAAGTGVCALGPAAHRHRAAAAVLPRSPAHPV